MSFDPGADPTLQDMREIDLECDLFESAWRSGSRPSVRDHVERARPELRVTLARELVLVDVAWRRRSGDEPSPEDYAGLASFDPAWVGRTTRRVGRFELIERVGSGAFGTVWRAKDEQLDRFVALKVLHASVEDAPATLDRFRREARAAARLSHPGIAAVHEATVVDGQPALVAELIEGRSLREVLASRRLEPREAAAIAAHVADALAYAHELGVVHRDLKPANVVLDEQRGRPVIVDFGLAREGGDASLTVEGEVLGTPAYMSPEQADGRSEVGPATDVYGLGAVLYEMACGRPPYAGRADEVLARVREGAAPRPRSVAPAVPRDLETIITTAMARSPADRYASARDLADDLRRFLDGEPVRARRESALAALARVVRRHRLAVATASTFLALLAAFAVVVTVQAARARREATAAASVAELLEGLFEAATPQVALGEELTAKEMVAVGTRRILEDETIEPLVRARLLRVLGNVHLDLGEPAAARPLLETSLSLRRDRLAADDPLVADSEASLARALLALSDVDGAEALARHALDVRAASAPRGGARASSLHQLGEIARARRHHDEALRLFEQARDARIAALGPAHPDVARDILALARATSSLGDKPRAAALAREAVAIVEAARGPDHVETGDALAALSQALRSTGKWEEALAVADRAMAITERVHGTQSVAVAHAAVARSELLLRAGRAEQAESELRRALAIADSRDPNGRLAASMATSLAKHLVNVKRMDEVEALYRRAHEIRLRRLPAGDPSRVSAAANLARHLGRTGRPEEAESLLRGALEEVEAAEPPDELGRVGVAAELASLLSRQRRHGDAMALVRGVAERWRDREPIPSTILGDKAVTLGDVALAAGHPAEALPFYLRAERVLTATEGRGDPNVARVLNQLGSCWRHLGCVERSAEAYERSIASWSEAYGAESRDALTCRGNLLALLVFAGRYDEATAAAEPLLAARAKGSELSPNALAGIAILRESRGEHEGADADARAAHAAGEALEDPSGLAAPLLAWGRILLSRGRPEEAEPVLARAVAAREAGGTGLALPWLDSHAEALRALGRDAEADAVTSRAAAMRASLPSCEDAGAID